MAGGQGGGGGGGAADLEALDAQGRELRGQGRRLAALEVVVARRLERRPQLIRQQSDPGQALAQAHGPKVRDGDGQTQK